MNGVTPDNSRNFFPAMMPWNDILATSLMSPGYPAPSQTATDMMQQGRPSFDWTPMGALAPLAGFVPQPEYRTPPPDPRLLAWWDVGPYELQGGNIQHSDNANNMLP